MLDGNQAAMFQARQAGALPGELKIEWADVSNGHASGGFTVEKIHMAPNGFMHAASVVALTDTACGYGCERVTCEARLLHGGRMTQVWDAEAVNVTTGKVIAAFRCTQMVLYPR